MKIGVTLPSRRASIPVIADYFAKTDDKLVEAFGDVAVAT